MRRIREDLKLIPENRCFDDLCDAIASRLEHAGVTCAALQATQPEVRERLVRRRYPELFSEPRTTTSKKKRR